MIIDSQVHAYERNKPSRPWAATLAGPDEVTGDDMVKAMDDVGVDGALELRPLYRLVLRLALVSHLRRLDLVLVDARRLRHLRQQDGLGRLLGSGHGRQHARARVLKGYLFEVLRQGRRGERPGVGQRAGEPEAVQRIRKDVTSLVVSAVGVRPAEVVVLGPGSLPKTPSGKLRRAATRALLATRL